MDTLMIGGVCRCCASEGPSKDLTSRYSWMGDEEIYSKMLLDCFDISLYMDNEGNNGGICEVCITQLRNAFQFKKQVQLTEDKFKKTIRCGTVTAIKLEVVREDCSDSEQDMQEEHLDDNSATEDFEVPIKRESSEEVEEAVPKKRPRPSTSKAALKAEPNSSRGPFGTATSKSSMGTISRVSELSRQTAVKSEQSAMPLAEMRADTRNRLENLKTLLLYSNATPIRTKDNGGYACNLCPDQYFEPVDLKRHFLREHSDKNSLDKITNRMFSHGAKLDITFLNCALCDSDIESIELLLTHLRDKHKKPIHATKDNSFLPFKFETPGLHCAICSAEFSNFKVLVEHMHTHYQNYVCGICSVGYSSKATYSHHMHTHTVTGRAYHCQHCEKSFPLDGIRLEHERRVHLGVKRYKCGICKEMFDDHYKKLHHSLKVHGVVQEVVQTCKACDRKFPNARSLRVHVRKHHLMERNHKCTYCDKAFFNAKGLSDHMISHVGGPKCYVCVVCKKGYDRDRTLRTHMRSHAAGEFNCDICSKAFTQKCSLKYHLKTKHGME